MDNPEIIGHELFPEPYLNNLINNAQRDVQMNLSGLALQRFITSKTGSVGTGEWVNDIRWGKQVATFKLSTLTDRMERPKSILDIETWYGFADSSLVMGKATEIDYNKFFDVIRNPYNKDYSKPIFTIEGENGATERYLLLFPILTYPVAGQNNFLQKVNYYRLCSELSTDADTLEIPVEYEHYVVKVANIAVKNALGQLNAKDEAISELMNNIKTTHDGFMATMNPALKNEIAPMDEGAKLQ